MRFSSLQLPPGWLRHALPTPARTVGTVTTRNAAAIASEAFRHLPVPHPATAPGTRTFTTTRSRSYRCASPGARASAAAIDFVLCIAMAPAILGLAAVVLREFWWFAAIGAAAAYLDSGWAEGATPGMHAAHVRLASVHDGRAPGWRRATVRMLLVLPPVCAAFLLADATIEGTAGASPLLIGATAVATLGIADYAWIVLGSHSRALHDVLSRTVLVSARPGAAKSVRRMHGTEPAGQP